jgi:hypothetical protein
MHIHRKFVPLAALALAALLPFTGCKGNTPQPSSQGAQPAQNPQQPSAAQPSGQGAEQTANPQSGQAATPPPPTVVDLPTGTRVRVSLDQDLGSKISQSGDSFRATVAGDVVVNGQTVIPRGARAEGIVVDAKPLGRFKGAARLELRLERVRTNWGSYPVSTSSIERAERGKGRRSAEFIGGGGGLGALVGGLAGGGKGLLIGGLVGAGAGTAGSAFTGNKQIFLPAGTLLSFRLEHSVHVTEQ